MKIIAVFFEVIFARILLFFGIEKNKEPIPKNTPYCYVIDHERNEKEPIDGYWIKPCKYYRRLKNGNSACTYIGFMGFDVCHNDQCKICGVKDELNKRDLV